MSLTWEKLRVGATAVIHLDAFPIFCAYLLMIAVAGKWKKVSKPLELRVVSFVLASDKRGIGKIFFFFFLHENICSGAH